MGISASEDKQGTMLNEINVTPFVDVALVLLVIFMVTAPMIGRGVEVNLPRTRAAVMEVDQSKLLLVINERREVYIGDQKVPNDRLEVVLRTNERIQREQEVFLQADRNVPYGFVVHIMAILREAGVDQLGLVTDPTEETGEVPTTPTAPASNETAAQPAAPAATETPTPAAEPTPSTESPATTEETSG